MKRPIADIGCGFGEFADVFFRDSFIDVGIDISSDLLVIAGEKKRYRKLIAADARDLPIPDNQFETVISISTLEHIEKVNEALKEAYRITKPGGTFIFTVPTSAINDYIPIPIIKSIFLMLYHRLFRHVNLLSKEEWLHRTEQAGFTVSRSWGVITGKQVMLHFLFLPCAVPSFIFFRFFKRRRLFNSRLRTKFLSWLIMRYEREDKFTDSIICVAATKAV